MSELALQLIAENKHTKSKSLDLGNCGLTELPTELFECVWLEELILSYKWWDFEKKNWIESKNLGEKNKLFTIDSGIVALQALKTLKACGDYEESWEISDISFLQGLRGLQSLDLSSNIISDISFLQGLTGLQFLNLSYNNKISDISFLQGLSGLQSLYLNSNEISNISFLQGLNGLQSLDLGSNEISNISFLQGLNGLQSLTLSSNQISDISFLQGLRGLQSLDLRYTQISDISFLQGLTDLQSLDLSSNQISDISFLQGLTGLQSLDLSNNNISDTSFLQDFTSLQSLYLSNNKISDISFLQGLTGLKSLFLSYNKISDFSFLQGLTGLKSLFLSNNQISDISFLQGLTGLKSLYLNNNKISDFSFLQGLTGLQSLYLSNNKISDISFLQGLTGLQSLEVRNNEISDISFLSQLTELNFLDLSNNQISEISLSFIEKIELEIDINKEYPENKGKLYLNGNAVKNIPEEVLLSGRKYIIEHLEGQLKPLNECKLIFVGDGGAGKTSLMRRLVYNDFDESEKTTHGINKVSWKDLTNKKEEPIKVNLWDFGGQHIQHSLHQFFFTERVIYVLVLNPRNDENANYWLDQVEKLGKGSEVLVVYNWKDAKDKEASYLQNFLELRKKYPALPEPFLLSCKPGVDDGVELFRQNLKEIILKNEGLQTGYRTEWFNIKQKVEENVDVETNFIEYAQYEAWCLQEKYNDPERRKELLKILNYIGAIVYFDKPVLNTLQVLNPEWITTGAYAILTAEHTKKKNGDLCWQDLKEIFREEKSIFSDKEIKIRYNENHFNFILELMIEYRLLQKKPNEAFSYLIPSAFGAKPENPVYEEVKTGSRQYRIQFESPFEMLIMHRFIAMNILNTTGYDYWYSGIYIKHQSSNTFALIETNKYSYRIDCWVKGHNIRGLWEIIRNDFREIFGMYHNFPFSEEVYFEKDGRAAYFSYDEMINASKDGISIIPYDKATRFTNIDVYEVLDLFETKQQTEKNMEREMKSGDTYIVNGDVKNDGQWGGKQNTQNNMKIQLAHNDQYKDLKEHILDLEEYQAEDMKWKELLMQVLDELNNMELADNKAQQKTSTDKIERIFKKLKNVKDWVAITLLPAEIATKGHKMFELWDDFKALF